RAFAERTVRTASTHSAARWTAAAAAAGLFLGIALGASYEWDWRARPARAARSASVVQSDSSKIALMPTATRGSDPAPSAATDDAFLSELETMLDRPRTTELQPLDVLTPHVRE